MPTNLQRAADAVLRERCDVSLDEFLATERAAGSSYEQMSRALYAATGGVIQVGFATIRRWTLSATAA